MNPALDRLLMHPGIWRGDALEQAAVDTLSSGFASLDAHLPGGGWPRGALTEILLPREGIGEIRLLLPALVHASSLDGWVAWVAPPHVPYAPALQHSGVRLEKLLVAKPECESDAWWTAEQAFRSGSCSMVLAWLSKPDERRLRRLQLGAESGHAIGILFRSAREAEQRSPAALRIRLEPAHGGLAVYILKRRGGQLASPVMLALDGHDSMGTFSTLPVSAKNNRWKPS